MKKNYLHVGGLYSKYPDWELWGMVGMDVETGDRIYLTDFDKSENFNPLPEDTLRRVVRGDKGDRQLWYYENHTHFPQKGCEGISDDVIQAVEQSIDRHMKYNKAKGLPTDDLAANRKRYSIVQGLDQSLFSYRSTAASWNPIDYTIVIPFTSFEGVDEQRKSELLSHLNHEVGHMKASHLKLGTNNLSVITGIYKQTAATKKQRIIDGGSLTVLAEKPAQSLHLLAMEEIANEMELKDMNPNYQCSYADFGTRLNKISDGALHRLRYNGNYDSFAESMLKINPSEKKFETLISEITEHYCGEYALGVAYVNSLMKEYELGGMK